MGEPRARDKPLSLSLARGWPLQRSIWVDGYTFDDSGDITRFGGCGGSKRRAALELLRTRAAIVSATGDRIGQRARRTWLALKKIEKAERDNFVTVGFRKRRILTR